LVSLARYIRGVALETAVNKITFCTLGKLLAL